MPGGTRRITWCLVMLVVLVEGAGAVDEGIIAAYDFSEGAGATLHDAGGNALHGTIHGAIWERFGERWALRFNGQDACVDCGEGQAFNPSGPMTVEAWILPEELPTGEAVILGRGLGSYLLTYSGSDYPARIYWHVARKAGKCRARASVGLWHHVVATWDGARIREYVDGATAGGVRVWRLASAPDGGPFRIGGGVDGFQGFKGLIGEVRVYGRTLSREEAFQRYQAGKPGRKPFPIAPPAPWSPRRLNNLVSDLLDVRAPSAAGGVEHRFTNPREGWVFLAITSAPGDAVRVALDGEALDALFAQGAGAWEVMRLLPAGDHVLSVRCDPPAALRRITVRAIPELIYATFPTVPVVAEYGPYSWEFLERDVLPNVNVLVGAPTDAARARLTAWRRAGRKFLAEHAAAWINPKTGRSPSSAEEIRAILADKPGLTDPSFDGMILDTHDVSHSALYPLYAEALRRIAADPAHRGRSIHFYCDALFGARESESFARAVIETGGVLAWTRYLHEQPTEEAAMESLESGLAEEAAAWRRSVPGSVEHMVMTLGYLTSPGERMNIEPGVNYRVFMDMQCRLLATHPAFAGLRGVMWYKSGYADEDAVRWAGRLFRHYFIEGNTSPLAADPYRLPHLRNPDFEDGVAEWTLAPAEEGSIAAGEMDRFGFQQGRWLETGVGDRFLRLRRSPVAANRFSQDIRRLEPGRLYSLELYVADLKAVAERRSVEQPPAVSVTIENADPVPEKSFVRPYSNWSYYHLGPYDDEESAVKAWNCLHRKVFRAKASTARLIVSDWAADGAPGGPVGQELAFNFIEVQPYLE